jgi:hypothetical protein
MSMLQFAVTCDDMVVVVAVEEPLTDQKKRIFLEHAGRAFERYERDEAAKADCARAGHQMHFIKELDGEICAHCKLRRDGAA